MPAPLRIGILGAAAIAPNSIIGPAKLLPELAVIDAVAARDASKAAEYAAKHDIPRVFPSYEELIADPDIDAVYIALPNSLHHKYSLLAIASGKHVLCEKPVASNADEAQEIAAALEKKNAELVAAGKQPLQFYEAFHWRSHPVAHRLRALIDDNRIGKLEHIESKVLIPESVFEKKTDIRFKYSLAGGALLDLGCYIVNAIRFATDDADIPVTVTRAVPVVLTELDEPQIDSEMEFDLELDRLDGSKITASAFFTFNAPAGARGPPRHHITLRGSKGSITVNGFLLPFAEHSIVIEDKETGSSSTEVLGDEAKHTTYYYQLIEFANAVKTGERSKWLPGASSAVNNMKIIDAIYDKAGLKRRGSN
ncbi:NAD(P)-binding protein [Ramicandelaber brevisporus]|nr:NAD(P)-binding protein [Ramicandelaber brevisporus]